MTPTSPPVRQGDDFSNCLSKFSDLDILVSVALVVLVVVFLSTWYLRHMIDIGVMALLISLKGERYQVLRTQVVF